MSRRRAIAVIDDDALVRSGLARLIRSFGLEVGVFGSAASFLASGPEAWAVVVTDIHMPEISGLDLLRRLRGSHPDLPVVVVTAFPDMRDQALAAGARDFLEKPCAPDRIEASLKTMLDEA